jgi:ribosome-binding factor A
MTQGARTNRVGEEFREVLAEEILKLKDPRVGFVTVTRTDMTPDLRSVRVHIGVLGDAHQRTRTLQGLAQAAGFIRRELGRRLRIRHTPEVSFQYDEGLDATDRVAQLLDQVRSGERDGDDPD